MKQLITLILAALISGSSSGQEMSNEWKSFLEKGIYADIMTDEGITFQAGESYPSLIVLLEGSAIETSIQYNGDQDLSNTEAQLITVDKTYIKSDVELFVINSHLWKKMEDSWNIVIVDGPIMAYKPSLEAEDAYVKKGDEDAISINGLMLGFKKSMAKLVADYTDLAGKISGKEKGYRMIDGKFFEILHEYNQWASK